ncbi:MAG: molybdopterin oxidoreductase family protein, partial [Spongiibacteraceae bacterium]
IMTVPNFPKRLKALQQRGGKLVVVDPRRSETAEVAAAHHFIKPGSDILLLLSLLQHIFAEQLESALPDYVQGLDEVKVAVLPFTPDSVAAHCAIPAVTIRQIAEDFAKAPTAVCHGRMGCSVQMFGGLCQWAIQVLNIVTGNLDQPGGAMFTQPAVDMINPPFGKPGNFDRWRSRVSQLPEFSGELPAVCMSEEMATAGDGQIRALITAAGNPVLSTPDGKALETQLKQLDFMVSIDPWINETTCHADVILPPTSPLEHDHYDLIFHSFAVRNTTRYSPAVHARPEGAMHDWEIYNALSERLANKLGMTPRSTPAPHELIDFALQTGPYSQSTGHEQALSLEKLKASPSGIDLGPLQSCLPERLQTADKKLTLNNALYLTDIPRAQELLNGTDESALVLIGRRHVRSNNSWMHNSHRLVKGKPRHQLLMHPEDMQQRQLLDGQLVRIQSRVGELQTEVQASDEVMPGVVSLPHGWGHHRPGVQQSIASTLRGESCNDLTDSQRIDPLSGNAAVNGVPVQVSAS